MIDEMEVNQKDHIPYKDSSLIFLPGVFHDFKLMSDLISRLGNGILLKNLGIYFFCCFRIKFFNLIGVYLEVFMLTANNRIKLLFVCDLIS